MQPDGMRPTRAGGLRWVLLTSTLAFTTPGAGSAEEPAPGPVQSWEAGARKSFFIAGTFVGKALFRVASLLLEGSDRRGSGASLAPSYSHRSPASTGTKRCKPSAVPPISSATLASAPSSGVLTSPPAAERADCV